MASLCHGPRQPQSQTLLVAMEQRLRRGTFHVSWIQFPCTTHPYSKSERRGSRTSGRLPLGALAACYDQSEMEKFGINGNVNTACCSLTVVTVLVIAGSLLSPACHASSSSRLSLGRQPISGINRKCVLTMASGMGSKFLQASSINIFIQSWVRHSPETHLVVFVGPEDMEVVKQVQPWPSVLSPTWGVQLVSTSVPLTEAELRAGHTPVVTKKRKFHRYTAFLEYLEGAGASCDGVVLSDSRDVIVQADVWTDPVVAGVLKEDSLVFSLEGNTAHQPFLIAESKWNEVALAKCYPADVVQVLGQMPLSCSGVTLGSANAIKSYLRAFTRAAAKALPTCMNDQPVHNYLLHHLPTIQPLDFKYLVLNNSQSPIMSFQFGVPAHLDEFSRIITLDGRLAPIVHQYDRQQELAQAYEAMYPITERRVVTLDAKYDPGNLQDKR